ncbi:hypothetical protein D6789_03570 [Candidatus Woesearchaeota archaeon]|nr:MAG: hypothetical protein D6789_03570 [Candidatus Woesearchaeota archaeon]
MFWSFLVLVISVAILVAFIAFLIWGMKMAVKLAVNSLIGFFALYAVKLIIPSLVISFWSVIITAVFGVFGLIFVVAAHAIGLAF